MSFEPKEGRWTEKKKEKEKIPQAYVISPFRATAQKWQKTSTKVHYNQIFFGLPNYSGGHLDASSNNINASSGHVDVSSGHVDVSSSHLDT